MEIYCAGECGICDGSCDQQTNSKTMETTKEIKHLTLEEATAFFSELYYGEHHLPSKVKQWGYGYCVEDFAGMATFDYSSLTRFVLMCHEKCIRGEIRPSSPKSMKVCIWKRQEREGSMSRRHPTIETVIQQRKLKDNG